MQKFMPGRWRSQAFPSLVSIGSSGDASVSGLTHGSYLHQLAKPGVTLLCGYRTRKKTNRCCTFEYIVDTWRI